MNTVSVPCGAGVRTVSVCGVGMRTVSVCGAWVRAVSVCGAGVRAVSEWRWCENCHYVAVRQEWCVEVGRELCQCVEVG